MTKLFIATILAVILFFVFKELKKIKSITEAEKNLAEAETLGTVLDIEAEVERQDKINKKKQI